MTTVATRKSLSPKEARVLRALESAPNGLNRAEIVDALYGDDPNGGPDSADIAVKVYIHNIRRKLAHRLSIVRRNGCGRYLLVANGDAPPMFKGVEDVLTPRQMELYTFIRRRPGIGTADLADLLGRSYQLVSAVAWRMNKVLPLVGERVEGHEGRGYRIVQTSAAAKAA